MSIWQAQQNGCHMLTYAIRTSGDRMNTGSAERTALLLNPNEKTCRSKRIQHASIFCTSGRPDGWQPVLQNFAAGRHRFASYFFFFLLMVIATPAAAAIPIRASEPGSGTVPSSTAKAGRDMARSNNEEKIARIWISFTNRT